MLSFNYAGIFFKVHLRKFLLKNQELNLLKERVARIIQGFQIPKKQMGCSCKTGTNGQQFINSIREIYLAGMFS